MNVIMSYLDTMFSAYPQTPRILDAKIELAGMMEDAYTSLIAAGRTENEAVGQVIRDFGNLEEVAPVLDITSDIAPEGTPNQEAAGRELQYSQVTLEEAQGYADAMARVRFCLTAAVLLFVLSPAVLISLPVAAEAGIVSISTGAAVFIGLLVLFSLVAICVVLLIAISRETAPYKRIPEGKFATNPVVKRWADLLAESNEHKRIRALQIAIVPWTLAAVPLIAFILFLNDTPQGGFWTVIGVVIVLVMVATGLGILLPQVWAHTVAEELGRAKGAPKSRRVR
ncbi:permease prefix domain 1-containing protein [Jonesiaceae bacterium BS-20]|uniref:Permease prefix domain 1-containing protein n=1 Tax=Jonesiaceae bacterium BS-20 TaxID=3120821 RepID=A0AAU7DVH8_9MICO